MAEIAKAHSIQNNFIIRDSFWGGKINLAQARLEFISNLIESDYVVATRGGGNFSYRLYEIMCCGRMPLFINTDVVLPFDWLIPYKDIFVWVEQKDLHSIPRILNAYH